VGASIGASDRRGGLAHGSRFKWVTMSVHLFPYDLYSSIKFAERLVSYTAPSIHRSGHLVPLAVMLPVVRPIQTPPPDFDLTSPLVLGATMRRAKRQLDPSSSLNEPLSVATPRRIPERRGPASPVKSPIVNHQESRQTHLPWDLAVGPRLSAGSFIAESSAKRSRSSSPAPSGRITGLHLSSSNMAAPRIQLHSPLHRSLSSSSILISAPALPLAADVRRSMSTPTIRTKTMLRHVDGVERLGEEMDKVFALVHGRGLGARVGGARRGGSGLRNRVGRDEEEEEAGEGMELDG